MNTTEKKEEVKVIEKDHNPHYRNGSYDRYSRSNQIITLRNRGVVHQFIDSIGGDSSNYR